MRTAKHETADDISTFGHREWVGGLWDEMGQRQFDFLIAQGLKPSDTLLDIACGSLRAGRLLIPYLDRGNYLGIDRHMALIEAGMREEVDPAAADKDPQFVESSTFEFSKFTKKPNVCVAQSLFTHLNNADITLCMRNLADFAKTGCRFYATFFEGRRLHINFIRRSGSHENFVYTRGQMQAFGTRNGWRAEYIGDWGHPRNQKMMLYTRL